MFYVDDKFANSDPVLRIPRAHRLAAVGLWTLCGTWSSHWLKDGWVPQHIMEDHGGDDEIAGYLVAAGLWRKKKGGYQFNDWARWQKTRAQVLERQKAERERKADYRSRSRGNTGPRPTDVPAGHEADPSHPLPTTHTHKDSQSLDELPAGSAQDGPSYPQAVDKSVDNTAPNYDRIRARLSELVEDVPGLAPMLVADHFLGKAKHPPKMATRYVLTCITNEPNTVTNYMHTGRWSE